MREKLAFCLWIGLFFAKLIGPVSAEPPPVTIFAAASLGTVLAEVDDMAMRAGLPRCRCVFAF